METALQKMGAIRRMADGGLVSPWSLKGIASKLTGPKESVSEKYARQDAERAAKGGGEPGSSPTPKAAPASPAPGSISGYAAGTAMQAREKAAGLKGGGAIKGKGTGTSDDIPIMASNGEFMIKAKAVKKIGLETLEALNAIADKPDEKDSKAERKAEGYKCGGAIKKMALGGEVDTATDGIVERQAPMYTPSAVAAPVAATVATAPKRVLTREEKIAAGQAAGAATMQGFNDIANMPLQGMKNGGAVRKMAMTGVPHMADAGLVDDAVKRAAQLSQSGGAVFGLYPQMTDTQHTTYATGDKLRSGVLATGPSTFQPAISNPSAPQPPIVGGGTGQRMDAATDPRVASMQSSIQATPAAAPAVPSTPTAPTPAAPATSPVIRNGNSFSGTNITGNQVSSLDTSQGYAQDLKDLARIDATKAAEQANAVSQEQYAQNAMLQDRALGRTAFGGRPAVAPSKSAAVQLGALRDQQTAQRGQDQQATQAGAIQKLAQQKFGLESQTAGLDNASKVQMQAAQAKLLAAKTPEEKLAAEENLRALQGKYEKAAPPDQYAYAPGGQAVDPATGRMVTQPGVIFNKQTGQLANQNASPALPPGMVKQIGTSGGKPVYLDKNGKQVIAKG